MSYLKILKNSKLNIQNLYFTLNLNLLREIDKLNLFINFHILLILSKMFIY
jgi:hypothetical protein